MNNVRFNLKTNPKSDPLVIMVFRFGRGQKLVMSTKVNIPEKYWDKSRMRAVNNYHNSISINNEINRYESALLQAYHELSKNGIPSVFSIKKRFTDIVGNGQNTTVSEKLLPYIINYIERVKKEDSLATGTIQGFDQLRKALSKFPNINQIETSDLTIDVLKDIQAHFASCLGYSLNQCEKLQRKLVTILNYACKADKLRVNGDYQLNYWKVSPKLDNPKIYYSNEEIRHIRDYPFEVGSKFDRVRDRWIIGFATGQRYSDFKATSIDDVRYIKGKPFIEIRQKKTDTIVNVPLYNDISKIFDKYNGFPPTFSDQKFNQYIKEVAQVIGFTEKITQYKFISSTRTIKEIREKWELTTSHVCRRSFATNGTLKGISLKYLMNITGHKKPKAFLDYVQMKSEDLPQNMPIGETIFL